MSRVLVLGAGFGGVQLIRTLERLLRHDPSVEITLVNRSNYMVFTPLLSEVSGNAIEERHAVLPLRDCLHKARFHQGEIRDIDIAKQMVMLEHADGELVELPYDYLAIALGSVTNYRKAPGALEHSYDLKSLSDAIRLRNHVLAMLELADVTTNPEQKKALLTFVGVGGGYAGVEGLGLMVDFVEKALQFYPHIKWSECRFILATRGRQLLESLEDSLSDYVIEKLEARGVEVRLGETCTAVTETSAELSPGGSLPTYTVLWAAGVSVNPLVPQIDLPKNQWNLLEVDSTLRVKGYSNIFALGDCAAVPKADGFYAPTAQNATREGAVAAHNIVATMRGTTMRPFVYHSVGSLASIGRYQAVAQVMGIPISGFVAWLMWRTIYLMKMENLSRQVRVLFDWALELVLPSDTVQFRVQPNDDLLHLEPPRNPKPGQMIEPAPSDIQKPIPDQRKKSQA